MNFSVALRIAKDGYGIQRRGWRDKHIKLNKATKELEMSEGILSLGSDDLMADDWKEFKED
ncbi:hypothetical protein [Clostridium perfringens]|uniref:hypothetical protein n=1 Tax=Clostridium perfringens TaxID=1502 RepID=UPI002B20D290|nr:hypothetical protein [Clostridium perfringens]MEA5268744.1 hypothetical protein [Clostridium perfringens]MEA5380333.1 hypothetical protein [Clostridium perfringens]